MYTLIVPVKVTFGRKSFALGNLHLKFVSTYQSDHPILILIVHAHTYADTVPAPIAPEDVKINSINPTEAQISWTPLPEEERNGTIIGYEIQVEEPNCLPQKIPVKDPNTTFVNIPNLRPFTPYTCNFSAVSKAGPGPAVTISFTTQVGGEILIIYLIHSMVIVFI